MEQNCEICGNRTYLIGTLGDLDHYCCRSCGWLQYETTDRNEEEVETT